MIAKPHPGDRTADTTGYGCVDHIRPRRLFGGGTRDGCRTFLEKHTGGQDKSNTVKNFLATLAENNRLGLLEGVCEKFGTLMGAARGEIELIITTAQVRICRLIQNKMSD